MSHLKLGSEAVDKVTGMSGILINRTELIGGTLQYALQLPATDKSDSYPDVMSIDFQQLEVVGTGISEQELKPEPFKFELGNEVEDQVSGFVGLIVSRTVFINGCLYYNVEKKGDAKQEDRQRFCVEQRLKFISDGIAEKKPVRKTQAALDALAAAFQPKAKPPGGPTTRAQRAC